MCSLHEKSYGHLSRAAPVQVPSLYDPEERVGKESKGNKTRPPPPLPTCPGRPLFSVGRTRDGAELFPLATAVLVQSHPLEDLQGQ